MRDTRDYVIVEMKKCVRAKKCYFRAHPQDYLNVTFLLFVNFIMTYDVKNRRAMKTNV